MLFVSYFCLAQVTLIDENCDGVDRQSLCPDLITDESGGLAALNPIMPSPVDSLKAGEAHQFRIYYNYLLSGLDQVSLDSVEIFLDPPCAAAISNMSYTAPYLDFTLTPTCEDFSIGVLMDDNNQNTVMSKACLSLEYDVIGCDTTDCKDVACLPELNNSELHCGEDGGGLAVLKRTSPELLCPLNAGEYYQFEYYYNHLFTGEYRDTPDLSKVNIEIQPPCAAIYTDVKSEPGLLSFQLMPLCGNFNMAVWADDNNTETESSCTYNPMLNINVQGCLVNTDGQSSLTCDDLNPNTENDIINSNCQCIGDIVDSTQDLKNESIKVFPNPFYQRLNIDVSASNALDIIIYSIDGKVQLKLVDFDGSAIDLPFLSEGLYFLQTFDKVSKMSKLQKIVKN